MPNPDQDQEDPNLPGTGIEKSFQSQFGPSTATGATATGGKIGAGGAGLPPPPITQKSALSPGGAPTTSAIPVTPTVVASSPRRQNYDRPDPTKPVPGATVPPRPRNIRNPLPSIPRPGTGLPPPPASSPGSIDFNQLDPAYAATPYGPEVGTPEAKQNWRSAVATAEGDLKNEADRGIEVTNLPRLLQSDWNDLIQSGDYGFNPDGSVRVLHTGLQTSSRPATAPEASSYNAYQQWVGDPNNAGAIHEAGGNPYIAYQRAQSIAAGVAPNAGYGAGTTAASSPIGRAPSGDVFNVTRTGVLWFDANGAPITPTPQDQAFAATGATGAGAAAAPVAAAPGTRIPTTIQSGKAGNTAPTTVAAVPPVPPPTPILAPTPVTVSNPPVVPNPHGLPPPPVSGGIPGPIPVRQQRELSPVIDTGRVWDSQGGGGGSTSPPPHIKSKGASPTGSVPPPPQTPVGRAAAIGHPVPRRAPTPQDHARALELFGAWPGMEEAGHPQPEIKPDSYNYNPFAPRGKQWVSPQV